MRISSAAFSDGGVIPTRYTCDGDDRSPPLAWTGVPPGTASLALIVDDPDAPDPARPKRIWVHWILYNLPPKDGSLPEGVAPPQLPVGTRMGMNDGNESGYGGPCPPIGRHRYFHRLYALDVVLPDLHTPTRKALDAAMAGHIVAECVLMGTYARPGS